MSTKADNMTFFARLVSLPVHLYRVVISPLLPGSCRYHPSCSAYALEAIEIHGGGRGGWLALKRLLRCHPFGGHGFDPVPGKEDCPHAHPANIKTSDESL